MAQISLMNFRPMLGSYMNVDQYRMFKIIPGKEGLAIDIPGRIILDLNPPDDSGRWFPKMTREISLTPGNIVEGKSEKMIMHQYFRLKKISVPGFRTRTEYLKNSGNLQAIISLHPQNYLLMCCFLTVL